MFDGMGNQVKFYQVSCSVLSGSSCCIDEKFWAKTKNP